MAGGGAADHEAELDLAAMSMKQRDSCGSFGHMARTDGSTQRLIRLSRRTLEQLDAMTQATGEPRDGLADRLLGEAIKTAAHPLSR
jgi:hypothetical protein